MKRKNRSLLPVLICLLAVLSMLVAARGCNEGISPDEQVDSNLESTGASTPVAEMNIEAQEAEQVEETYNPVWDMPTRVARYVNIELTDEEWEELAAIVSLEAGNQCAEGQQAVVEVVFNRVLHSGFPDTVHDVLHDGEGTSCPQFSTIGLIRTATPTQAQFDAIYNALYGDTILDADVVFFSLNGENDRVWGKIGDHVFCREYLWE